MALKITVTINMSIFLIESAEYSVLGLYVEEFIHFLVITQISD